MWLNNIRNQNNERGQIESIDILNGYEQIVRYICFSFKKKQDFWSIGYLELIILVAILLNVLLKLKRSSGCVYIRNWVDICGVWKNDEF